MAFYLLTRRMEPECLERDKYRVDCRPCLAVDGRPAGGVDDMHSASCCRGPEETDHWDSARCLPPHYFPQSCVIAVQDDPPLPAGVGGVHPLREKRRLRPSLCCRTLGCEQEITTEPGDRGT